MVQSGAWNWPSVHAITEGTPGSTPTTGTWLPIYNVKNLQVIPHRNNLPIVGIGRQNESDRLLVKKWAEFNIEVELHKKQTTPAYDPYTIMQYIIEMASGADGSPDNTLETFSLRAQHDLATDEFFWLKGCMLDKVEIVGRNPESIVQMNLHGIAQYDDYGTTNPVSGSATAQNNPTSAAIGFGDCDVLYDPATPATILSRVNSFRFTIARTLDKRGVDSTTPTLYREFVPKERYFEAELSIDFDSKTEFEHFIDVTKTKLTFEIPNAAGGSIFALTTGYWLDGSEIPVREIDLLNLKLQGRFATLARTAHG
jgi:hypothetical protein